MEDTTNISELPIKSNIPHKEQDEISNQIDIGESKISMDSGIHNNIVTKKSVQFSENDQPKEDRFSSHVSNQQSGISNELKLILLASVIFFIFIDNKFKKYIIDILTQIFGSFLKTETGGTSKIGNIFYSMTFGVILYIFTRLVDITSLQLLF